jgi:hypothetical protein
MLNRDRLNSFTWPSPQPVNLIMNGWFTHNPENWPPHPAVQPLIVSFHLSDQSTANGFSAAEALVVGENAAWLRRHGPVGARDQWTLDLLRLNDIDAWYSGCLTLTLQPAADTARHNYVVINDLSDELAAIVRQRVAAPVLRTTHTDTSTRRSRDRFAMAERLLRLYAGARCVITSRLHCALPCLAMGTPVLLVPRRSNMKRFSGLANLVPHCTADEFRQGQGAFDLQNPPQNPMAFVPLRDKLIDLCSAFAAGARSSYS